MTQVQGLVPRPFPTHTHCLSVSPFLLSLTKMCWGKNLPCPCVPCVPKRSKLFNKIIIKLMAVFQLQ